MIGIVITIIMEPTKGPIRKTTQCRVIVRIGVVWIPHVGRLIVAIFAMGVVVIVVTITIIAAVLIPVIVIVIIGLLAGLDSRNGTNRGEITAGRCR